MGFFLLLLIQFNAFDKCIDCTCQLLYRSYFKHLLEKCIAVFLVFSVHARKMFLIHY